MFKNLFRRPAAAAPSRLSSLADSRVVDARRESLTIAVRETLRRHGFPQHWVVPEAQAVITRHRERGLQLRLVVREWQPSFLGYSVSLQKAIRARMLRLDPMSAAWFVGVTWKFDPIDDSACPPLPAASGWATLPAALEPAASQRRALPVLRDAVRAPHADFLATQPMVRDELARA
jgi:hypothetical protein